MFDLPLHPVVVHLPIALSVLLPLVTLALLVLYWRDGLSRKAWLLVPLLSGVLLAGGLTAAQTGEQDEEAVERVVAESAIEAHEEAAELFNIGAGVLFALAMVGLAIPGERRRKVVAVATAVGSLAVLGLGVNVGHAGGELVYRHGAASVHATPGASGSSATTERGALRYDDDD